MKIEQLAEWLESGLNDNDKDITFNIETNYQKFETAILNRERYEIEDDVYGVLNPISSDPVPVKNLGNDIINAELRLVVTTDSTARNNLKDVYDILQRYYEFNIGSVDKFEEYTIVLDMIIPTPTTANVNTLGDTITIVALCTFTVIKSAITFNETKWFLDGVEMTQILSWSFNNAKTQEKFNPTSTTINKNYFTNQTLVISIVVPHLTVSWFQGLFVDHYRNRNSNLNKTYTLRYEDPANKGADSLEFKVALVELPIVGEPAKANGVVISFAEVLDEE